MYTAWHVDKYKITHKLVTSHWTNEILQHTVVSSDPSRPGIIDARARRLRNTVLDPPRGPTVNTPYHARHANFPAGIIY